MHLKFIVVLAMCSLLCPPFNEILMAEESNVDSTQSKETQDLQAAKMQWWNTARFGMFVHWGVYAATGGEFRGYMPTNSAEWMMNKAKISIADYKVENVDKFNPTKFDADMFVALAKEAGMKYLVITAKHHDGFSMFHSKASPYNVVDATPFKRDVMKELALACRKQGIRFGFYYSQCQDWHHPGGMGNNWDNTIEHVSFDEYVREKAAPEIRQLLTEYGPIAIFWWDTPRDMSEEAFNTLLSCTELQPGIITNDRLDRGDGGDYKTYERKIPRKAPSDAYWEVCMPISGSWGYKKTDTSFKSTETLIRNLCDIASKGGNYLLNVSPTGEGTLLPQATERLKAIGKWMRINSDAIYGTSASPFGPLEWGRCTKKSYARGTTLYLHVFDWPEDGQLLVPGLKSKISQAYLMADWQALKTETKDKGLVVSLPTKAPDEIASVVVVQVQGPLVIDTVLPQLTKDGTLTLLAEMAYLHNNEGSEDLALQEPRREGPEYLGHWVDEEAWAEWSFKVNQSGRYAVTADLSLQRQRGRGGRLPRGEDRPEPSSEAQTIRLNVGFAGQLQSVEVRLSRGQRGFVNKSLGTIEIENAGNYRLQLKPEKGQWTPINLSKIVLTRQ